MNILKLLTAFILILPFGCNSPNPKLEEAHILHNEVSDNLQLIKNKIDSLTDITKNRVDESELKALKARIDLIEMNLVEVPGYEEEHNHKGHNHDYETVIAYTDDQILLIQREVKSELQKISNSLEKMNISNKEL